MTLPRFLLTTAAVLSIATVSAQATPAVTVLASGVLRNLNGVKVGQVSIERQGGRVYVHVTGAGRVAGANLELLVSGSNRALKAGDHTGPGAGALRAGPFEQAEVRYALPATVRPGTLHTVWVWCPSVRLPSAWARLDQAGR